MEKVIQDFYSQPQQLGGSFFAGSRRHVGGGILGTIARFALPLLRNIGSSVLNVASNTAKDVIDKKIDWKESVKKNAFGELKRKLNKKEINKQHDIYSTSTKRRRRK